jgi:hypothetical protein
MFMPSRIFPTTLALIALLGAAPVLAQTFDVLRPPGTVGNPSTPDDAPPPAYPPDQPRYPQGRPYPQQYPAQQYPGQRMPAPGDVQTQPLPPPPGQSAPSAPPRQAQPRQAPAMPPPPVEANTPKSKSKAGPKQAAPAAQPPAASQPNPNAPEAAEVPVEQAPIQRISNPTAVFSGLDKITGRIINFEAAIDETVQFGALQVTPRACYTRPPTEIQNTTAFVEVDEITLAGDIKRIFTGWMFANSPGLHAVEHPIYDVWVTDCKTTPPAVAQSGGKQ